MASGGSSSGGSGPLDTLYVEIEVRTQQFIQQLNQALGQATQAATQGGRSAGSAYSNAFVGAINLTQQVNSQISSAMGQATQAATQGGQRVGTALSSGINNNIQLQIAQPLQQAAAAAQTSAQTAGSRVGNGFSGAFAGAMGTAVAAVGALTAALGAVGLAGFNAASDTSESMRKIQATLGVTSEEAKRLSETAAQTWGDNWGSSITEVADDIIALKQQVKGLGDDELRSVTGKLHAIADNFGKETKDIIGPMNTLMKQFGLTSEEALDFIAKGFQKGLNGSDDFLDTIGEYSTQFANGGASASEFFSTLETGFAGGVLGTDKAADAFKEFRVRIQDGSSTTSDALKQIGIDSAKLAAQMKDGSVTAADAFKLVLARLNETKDANTKMQAGVGLLGTQYEDLGQSIVGAMDLGKTSTKDLAGATDALNVRYGSLGSALEGIKRQAILSLKPIGDELLKIANQAMPYVTKAFDWFKTNIPPIVSSVIGYFKQMGTGIGGVLDGIKPYVTALTPIFMGLGTLLKSTWELFKTAWDNVAKPILIALEPTFRAAFEGISAVVRAVLGVVNGLIKSFSAILKGDWQAAWDGLKKIVDDIGPALKQAIGKMLDGVISALKGLASGFYDIGVSWIESLQKGMASGWDKLKGWAKDNLTLEGVFLKQQGLSLTELDKQIAGVATPTAKPTSSAVQQAKPIVPRATSVSTSNLDGAALKIVNATITGLDAKTGFEKAEMYCSRWVRQVFLKAVGSESQKLFGGTALVTEQNFAAAGFSKQFSKAIVDSLKPGDLVFYANDKSKAGHVGVYTGNGQVASNNTIDFGASGKTDARGVRGIYELGMPTSVARYGGFDQSISSNVATNKMPPPKVAAPKVSKSTLDLSTSVSIPVELAAVSKSVKDLIPEAMRLQKALKSAQDSGNGNAWITAKDALDKFGKSSTNAAQALEAASIITAKADQSISGKTAIQQAIQTDKFTEALKLNTKAQLDAKFAQALKDGDSAKGIAIYQELERRQESFAAQRKKATEDDKANLETSGSALADYGAKLREILSPAIKDFGPKEILLQTADAVAGTVSAIGEAIDAQEEFAAKRQQAAQEAEAASAAIRDATDRDVDIILESMGEISDGFDFAGKSAGKLSDPIKVSLETLRGLLKDTSIPLDVLSQSIEDLNKEGRISAEDYKQILEDINPKAPIADSPILGYLLDISKALDEAKAKYRADPFDFSRDNEDIVTLQNSMEYLLDTFGNNEDVVSLGKDVKNFVDEGIDGLHQLVDGVEEAKASLKTLGQEQTPYSRDRIVPGAVERPRYVDTKIGSSRESYAEEDLRKRRANILASKLEPQKIDPSGGIEQSISKSRDAVNALISSFERGSIAGKGLSESVAVILDRLELLSNSNLATGGQIKAIDDLKKSLVDLKQTAEDYADADIAAGLDALSTRIQEGIDNQVSAISDRVDSITAGLEGGATSLQDFTDESDRIKTQVDSLLNDPNIDADSAVFLQGLLDRLTTIKSEVAQKIQDLDDADIAAGLDALSTRIQDGIDGQVSAISDRVDSITAGLESGAASLQDFTDESDRIKTQIDLLLNDPNIDADSAVFLQVLLDRLTTVKSEVTKKTQDVADSIRDNTLKISQSLNDASKTIEAGISTWTDVIKTGLSAVASYFGSGSDGFGGKILDAASGLLNGLADVFAAGGDYATRAISKFAAGIQGALSAISNGNWVGGIIQGVTAVVNGIVDIVNGASKSLADAKKSVQETVDAFKFVDVSGLVKINTSYNGSWSDLFGPTSTAEFDEVGLAIATTFEKGVQDGIKSGMKGFLNGDSDWMSQIGDAMRDTIQNAIIDAVIQGGIIQGMLAPILGRLSAAVASGDKGAIATATQELKQAMPGVQTLIETTLGPIKGIIDESFPKSSKTAKSANAGSIDALTSELADLRDKYSAAATDQERKVIGSAIKDLEAKIANADVLNNRSAGDNSKGAKDTYKIGDILPGPNIIQSIEKKIADLKQRLKGELSFDDKKSLTEDLKAYTARLDEIKGNAKPKTDITTGQIMDNAINGPGVGASVSGLSVIPTAPDGIPNPSTSGTSFGAHVDTFGIHVGNFGKFIDTAMQMIANPTNQSNQRNWAIISKR